jgi:serine/threonine protein phosphatase 1
MAASRTLAIGDIHGCMCALDTLLAAVQPAPGDTLITLGDYVDRGPDSRGAIDRLLKVAQTIQLIPLRGNHDWMMTEARHNHDIYEDWLGFGGRETLASYGPNESFENVPAEHWQFLDETLVDFYETETHFFVHALAHPDLDLRSQSQSFLHWHKLHPSHPPHSSGKIMICGHTAQKSGLPLNLGHAVCIDTWVYGAGWLTCLEVEMGQIWQANQQGELRAANLKDVPVVGEI